MKRLLSLLSFVCLFAVGAFATGLSGTYRIGSVTGADYATLSEAATALRTNGFAGDVTFKICSDIAEVGNVGLVNESEYTLTICPDAAVKRTIDFGTIADNAGPSGHVVIGYNLAAWASTDTKNVIIDGAFEGEGQYLEFRGGTVGGVVVVYYGKVTNSVVKNCRLISPRTSNTTYVVHFRSEKSSDKAPTGVGFENCYMQVTGVGNAQAVYYNGSQSKTAAGKPKQCYIRGCEIVSNLRGAFYNGAIDPIFENNIVRINGYNNSVLSHGVLGNDASVFGTVIVRGNKFVHLETYNSTEGNYGVQGITASGGATVWMIENNYFAGMTASYSTIAGKAIKLTYVRCGDSCVVRHNSFYMPVLKKTPSTTLMSANPISCLYLAGTKKYPVENNIFVSAETSANNSLIRGSLNANVKNNVFYHAGGNAAILAGAVVAADQEAFFALDGTAGSVWKQPEFTDAANGDLSLAAADNDLKMARLATVLKDINGTDRPNPTYAGAYEPTPVTSVTINQSQTFLAPGQNATLTATVVPEYALDKAVTWASDNAAVTVNASTGVVTAVSVGDAHITATAGGITSTAVIVSVREPVAHIYAYDLSRALSTVDYATYTFKFKPNTDAPAGGNNLVFYKESDGSLVGRIAISGALTAGTEKSVVLTKAELPACDEPEPMTWAVELTGADSKVVGQYLDNSTKTYDVYSPRGVVVNNCPESNNFGKLYISNALSGTTETGSSQTQGIFVFDAKLGRLSPANQGYTGGVSWPSGNGAPYRIVADEDGNIYISGNDADVQGVWMMAADPSQNFSKIITAKIYGFDVVGSGSSRVLYGMEAITISSGNLKSYAFGSQIPFTGSGETIVSSTSLKQVSSADNIISDGNGGFWISQNRGTEKENEPILIHITSNGTIDYNSYSVGLGLTDSRRGALALNKDKTRLAVSTGAGYVAVYDISYNGSGVPSLTKIAQTTAQHGNIDGIAFDYAGNLFIVSASDERLYAYALPMEGSNTSIVPAKAALTVTKAINVPATGVSLNKTETSLLVGASETLVATVLPTEPLATNQVVTWESDDEDVVTVSSTGELTAIHDGTATITVTSDDGGFTATCEVTVTKTAVTNVTLNHTSYELPPAGTVTLTATVVPDNASYPTVTWTTDDDAVATVTSAGVVTAVAAGTATITATADGVSEECTIVVSDPVVRIFAYDLRSVLDGSDYKLSFKSNIPYTSGNIILYDNGEQYGTKIPITANPMIISRSSLPEGKELTWAVELSADANKHVGEFTDASRGIYNFYLPQGVAVDNSTESDYFGRIYITEPNNGSSDGGTDRTKSQKAGLFVYDPQLNELNTTNQGYNLGLTMPQTRANFHRVAVDEAGMIYVNSTTAIYQADPAALTTSTAIGSGFTNLHSFAVTGAGDDREFCMILNANISTGGAVKTLVAPFASAVDLIPESTVVAAVADNSIVPDGRGGWWTSQNRYSADAYSLLSHISSTGSIDFRITGSVNTALAPEAPVSYRGVVAVNREGTLLALGSAKTVQLYDITYVAGVPSLTKSSIVMPNLNSAANTNIDGLAFDYAGNLYVVCATTERFYAFTLPTDDNTCIVPAKSTLTLKKWDDITLDETDEDNLDIIAANDGRGLNVVLKRPFTSTEHWYTLVLPFDVTAAQLEEAFGAGTEVAVLQETYWKNDAHTDLFLRFVPQANINAGEPCLFKPAQVIDEQVVFHGVTIDNQTPSLTSDVVDMIGMYSPTDVTVNEVNYYLGNTNLLHLYVDAYKNTKGFRAYFHFTSPLPAHASARVIFHKDVVTDIEDLQSVDAPAIQKVIRDGQLIIIREGKEYNAQGQLVR